MSKEKISNQHHTVRLYNKDNLYLKNKVKEFGLIDKRFENNTAAIRYYARLGIAYEKRVAAANSLDDTIIKSSQKEVIIETLTPVKNSIDSLVEIMKDFNRKQDAHFQESNNLTEKLTRRIESQNELLTLQLNKLLEGILSIDRTTEESLRNIIVLRAILYVFLLGYIPGRIDPKEKTDWKELITFTHLKAQELSISEIKHMAEGTLETDVVEELSRQMFLEIRRIQKTSV